MTVNYKLVDPHHWTDVTNGRKWSTEVRTLFEKLGFKVKHSEYSESFFYTKNGELRGCGFNHFLDCECKEIDLQQLRELLEIENLNEGDN